MRKITLLSAVAVSLMITAAAFGQSAAPTVADDPSTLNPAFRYSAQEAAGATAAGVDLARRNIAEIQIIGAMTQTPHWTRGKGEGNTVSGSSVLFEDYRAHDIVHDAYKSAVLYEQPKDPAVTADSGYYKSITFHVILDSQPQWAPRATWYGPSGDVTAQKFVLTDDKGDVIPAETGSTDGADTTDRFTGHEALLPYYEIRYHPTFSLFDANGHALIGPDVHTMTLHIIVQNGEQAVDYKLADLK